MQRMHETMDKYDVDPSYIEVEVTESVMTEKLEDLKHCMIELAQMDSALPLMTLVRGIRL